jgi:8-amino-7-oxononanoate synthase
LASWLESLSRLAESRSKAGLTRQLRPRPADDSVVDLAGNDYLGLAAHPAVVEASVAALRAYGLGATGSRLVRGSTDAHQALESSLAGWLGCSDALVFSSGYLANLAAVRSLAGFCDLIVSDAYNHASLIDGCKISGVPVVVAPHNSPGAVADILDAHPGRRALVVTESVFSVDGDLASLSSLHAVTAARGAWLLVDDAHALGVLGPRGAGGVVSLLGEPLSGASLSDAPLVGAPRPGPAPSDAALPGVALSGAALAGAALGGTALGGTALGGAALGGVSLASASLAGLDDVIVTATLSKSLGGAGGVVAGPAAFIRHLIDTGRTFIYDTALPPAVAAGALAAVSLAQNADDRRAVLAARGTQVVSRLGAAGFPVSPPAAGVLSVVAPGPISDPDFARALDVIVETAP